MAFWNEFFKIPGMTLTFKTDRFVYSNDCTMATEIAPYAFGMGEGENRTVDLGKTVRVARRRTSFVGEIE